MRKTILPTVAGLALLAVWSVPVLAQGKKETVTVELSAFKFKVPDDMASLFGHNEDEGKLFFYTNGPAEATAKAATEGEYEIVIRASGDSALGEQARFILSVDGKQVGKEVVLTEEGPKDYKLTTKLKAGDRKLTIEFTNDVFKEGEYDRNLYIHEVKLTKVK